MTVCKGTGHPVGDSMGMRIGDRATVKEKFAFNSIALKGYEGTHMETHLKLIKEAKMSKYDADTVRAIKESIEHHEDNLDKLRNGKGKFSVLSAGFLIGGVETNHSAANCALCEKFSGGCLNCPLSIEGYECIKSGSPYRRITDSKTKEQALAAEENMVKVLKSLLEEEEVEFKIGDRVVITYENDTTTYKKGWKGTLLQDDNCPLIRFDNGIEHCVFPDRFKLIKKTKKEEEMSIKEKIENINEDTTLKELDDLIVEISDKGNEGWRGLYIGVQSFATEIGFINNDGKVIKCVNFKTQCEKLEALRKALLWLAEKSGKLKDNQKEIKEIKEGIKKLQGKLEEYQNSL